MITRETRINFPGTTRLSSEMKVVADYVLTSMVALQSAVADIQLPNSDIEECKKWINDNRDKSILLSMLHLYNNVIEYASKNNEKIDSDVLDEWIKKNSNSIQLCENYNDNIPLLIHLINKDEEKKAEEKKVKDEDAVDMAEDNEPIIENDELEKVLDGLNLSSGDMSKDKIMDALTGILDNSKGIVDLSRVISGVIAQLNNEDDKPKGEKNIVPENIENTIPINMGTENPTTNIVDTEFTDVKQDIRNNGLRTFLDFGTDTTATVPVKLITSDTDGHTVEVKGGFTGQINQDELLPMVNGVHQISAATSAKIYTNWKRLKLKQTNDVVLAELLKTISNKYKVTSIEPVEAGLYKCTVSVPENTEVIVFYVDQGVRLTRDNKVIIYAMPDGTDELKPYYLPIDEKNLINNICENKYADDYLDKLNMIPFEESALDNYICNISMDKADFHKFAKTILSHKNVMSTLESEHELSYKTKNPNLIFSLTDGSNDKKIVLENANYTITINNGKANIRNKNK